MNSSSRVLMVFLDGVGIGRKDPDVNPFFAAGLPEFRNLLDGCFPHLGERRIQTQRTSLVPLNATLGVKGLPQSGTGQTTLFTGINASRLIGKHFGPYPYSSLRPVIEEHNIFQRLARKGKSVFYANAYPQRYFDHLAAHKNHITATAMAWLSSGFALNDYGMLQLGKALSADVTNEHWVKLGFGDVPVLGPRQAGHRLVTIAQKFDFVLYDYFFTDHAGHSQSMKEGVKVLEMLDEFVGGITESVDEKSMTFLMTSDHGNLEDLSTKTHTRNPVPLLALGARRRFIASRTRSLTHVTPAILEVLN